MRSEERAPPVEYASARRSQSASAGMSAQVDASSATPNAPQSPDASGYVERNGVCGCRLDQDCNDPALASCDSRSGTCVACVNDRRCRSAPKLTCDVGAFACVECLQDGDCESGHCNEQDHVCVACEADMDCPTTNRSHCNTAMKTCAPCSQDAHCSHLSATPACDSGKCVGCTDDGDCGGKRLRGSW